jgi:sugar phosphate isomerase/epimerase
VDADLGQMLDQLGPTAISGLTVPAFTFDANGWPRSEQLLAASRFDIDCLISPSFLTLSEPDRWPVEQQRLRDVIDLCERLGSPLLYGTTGPRGRLSYSGAVAALGDGMAPVLAYARERGITVLIEPTLNLRTNIHFVFTMPDLIDVCAATGLGLCIDLTACFTERDIEVLLERVAGEAHMVQVGDFVTGTSCAGQRAVPGDGDIPLDQLIQALVDGGFDGLWDVELLGDRMLDEGPATALARGWGVLATMVEDAENRS